MWLSPAALVCRNVLVAEVASWKQRNQKLLDKYGAVDPEVHRKLKADLEAAFASLESAQKAVSAARAEAEAVRHQKAAVEADLTKAQTDVKTAQEELKSATARVAQYVLPILSFPSPSSPPAHSHVLCLMDVAVGRRRLWLIGRVRRSALPKRSRRRWLALRASLHSSALSSMSKRAN